MSEEDRKRGRAVKTRAFAVSILVAALLACKSEPRPGQDKPDSVPAQVAPSAKPESARDPLAIPCVESTWPKLAAAAPEAWTKRECGDGLAISYKRHNGRLSMIIKTRRSGKKATAMMKPAIESVLPNLPVPKSLGACGPSPALVAAIRQSGGDVEALKARTSNEGGRRVALFAVGATTLLAEGWGTWDDGKQNDEGTGATADFRLSDGGGDFDETSWSAVPWEAKAPCDYAATK
ncbi:MAG: hypothetical protein IPM35_41175 [Myxococcales bacterium]|nr:hypothetical protein [Myxococcales bacterium]